MCSEPDEIEREIFFKKDSEQQHEKKQIVNGKKRRIQILFPISNTVLQNSYSSNN